MAFNLEMKRLWKIILYPLWFLNHIVCIVCWRIKRRKFEQGQRKDDCSYVYSETTLVQEGTD